MKPYTTAMSSITREKLRQATDLVAASDADVWLTFVRETAMGGDPVLPLMLSGGLTWQSALLVTAEGQKIAILGNYDADPLKESGDWDEVVPYVQGIKAPLLEQLEKHVPRGGKIAVNYSPNDVKADGLSHGMFVLLTDYLAGTRFADCLISAEPIVMCLRSVKTPAEVTAMRSAILATEALFEEIGAFAKIGVTEREVYEMVHEKIKERGLGFAWDPVGDPIVNTGPNSMIGHGIASPTIRLEPGHVFHIDLGVIKNGYSSDIQRCWYVGEPGSTVPDDVALAMQAVVGAITVGSKALKPGVLGHEVDAAARSHLVGCGYDEYLHAFGHQVGRVAHDGGAILGPKWERYGTTPSIPIRKGEVYTLELGVILENRGYLGLEEMVVVGADGCDWLTNRQLELPTICYS